MRISGYVTHQRASRNDLKAAAAIAVLFHTPDAPPIFLNNAHSDCLSVNTEKTPAAETPCSFYFVYFPSPSLSLSLRARLLLYHIIAGSSPPRLSPVTPVARLSSMNCVTHIKFARVKKKRQREGRCACVYLAFAKQSAFTELDGSRNLPPPPSLSLSVSLSFSRRRAHVV